MAEDSPWHETSMWIRVAAGALAGILSGRMIDRYGWGDGFFRTLAIVLLATFALEVYFDARRGRHAPPLGRALLAGQALGCVLYLVATFGLGERGPGGTLCVAALALFGVASVGLLRLRPSASA